MNKFWLSAILCLCSLAGHAAVSVVQTKNAGGAGVTSQAVSFTSTPSVGHSVIVVISLRNIGSGNTITSVTDNQTGNTYSLVASELTGGGSNQGRSAQYWCPSLSGASGTFTVTVTTSNSSVYIGIIEASGLSGSTDVVTTANDGGTQALAGSITAGSANTGNDLTVANISLQSYATGTSLSDPANTSSGVSYSSLYIDASVFPFVGGAEGSYRVATSTVTDNASWTWTTTADNYAMTLVSYKPAGAGCTHAGYTSGGAIATPNGSSGSYVGKSGAFVTPDCSSVNYWQPAVGNFGAN